jgi:NO-binding membrane sensor protein with MHYT domain
VNTFALVRAVYGVVLLCAPGALLQRVTGRQADRRSRVTARVLGVRHVTQAAATAANPGPDALRIGSSVDAMHSASMLGLAMCDQSRRRVGLVDAAVAATFSGVGLLFARRPSRRARSSRSG